MCYGGVVGRHGRQMRKEGRKGDGYFLCEGAQISEETNLEEDKRKGICIYEEALGVWFVML